MSAIPVRWTAEEWARAKSLLDAGYRVKAVAQILGRDPQNVSSKLQYMKTTEERLRDKNWKRRKKYAGDHGSKIHRVDSIVVAVPAEALVDRNARAAAPRSLTAFVFGDPPPGWSALDRRIA